jgi:hypothetical protein
MIKYQDIPEVYTDKDYYRKYNSALRRIRKVYPLALYAAEKLDEIDENLKTIDSRRKKKKYSKNANKEIKEDFQFVIKDLYTSEGIILMKLIHRETGMTVSEIIRTYRSKLRADVIDNLGKIWEQDLNVKYDPKGEDWIIEQVILDIQNNTVAFKKDAKILSKEEYKENQKQYKIDKKAAKKAMRAKRKAGSSEK